MQNTELLSKIDLFIEDNKTNILNDLSDLIAIPSLESAPLEGMPFGEEPAKALALALEKAEKMGFKTHNADNFIGWADIEGKSGEDKYLASITHLDIVPEGNGWDASPYEMRVKDGWILGRGVADDKGPSVALLYAAKFIKDYLGTPKYTFRVLLGCNEETGMKDVEYYLENYPEPLFAFSPDAEFPVCNGEKGRFEANFVSKKICGNVVSFNGGVASNVVPDRAYMTIKADASTLPASEGLIFTTEGEAVKIEARGIGGHASMPENTINAIGLVTNYVLDNNLLTDEEKPYFELLRDLFSVTDGSGVGVDRVDPMGVFTALTCVGGMISYKDGVFKQNMDMRYPTAITGDEIRSILTAKAGEFGAMFEEVSCAEPFYIDADNDAIRALLDTYNEVTGKKGEPFTMGGGTYARHFKNAVSYGPEEFDTILPDFAGPMHGANEGVSIKSLLDAVKIYILAILRLEELEF